MLKLVKSVRDVRKNLMTLDECRYSLKDRDFYDSIIQQGRVFVAYKVGEKYLFAPSRFAGYSANNPEKHIKSSHLDGRKTNTALKKLLGDYSQNQRMEKLFLEHCKQCGIKPEKVPNERRYWIIEEDTSPETRYESNISGKVSGNSRHNKTIVEPDKKTKDFRYVGLQSEKESIVLLSKRMVQIEKRHIKLMNSFKKWIDNLVDKRHLSPIKEDRFDAVLENWNSKKPNRHLLIEAKTASEGTDGRTQIRQAIGQLFDYRLTHFSKIKDNIDMAVLLPSEPADGIINLLKSLKIEVLWFSDAGRLEGTIAEQLQ